jgi:hypothetical protein
VRPWTLNAEVIMCALRLAWLDRAQSAEGVLVALGCPSARRETFHFGLMEPPGSRTVTTSYVVFPELLPRPDAGKQVIPLVCPGCGREVQIEVRSLRSVARLRMVLGGLGVLAMSAAALAFQNLDWFSSRGLDLVLLAAFIAGVYGIVLAGGALFGDHDVEIKMNASVSLETKSESGTPGLSVRRQEEHRLLKPGQTGG